MQGRANYAGGVGALLMLGCREDAVSGSQTRGPRQCSAGPGPDPFTAGCGSVYELSPEIAGQDRAMGPAPPTESRAGLHNTDTDSLVRGECMCSVLRINKIDLAPHTSPPHTHPSPARPPHLIATTQHSLMIHCAQSSKVQSASSPRGSRIMPSTTDMLTPVCPSNWLRSAGPIVQNLRM
jgi:hypothetical protein